MRRTSLPPLLWHTTFLVVVVVLGLTSPAVSRNNHEPLVKSGWEERIRTAIFTVADTDFESGLKMFQRYIDAFPTAPEGYFFYAAAVEEKMMKQNDLSEMPRFNQYARKMERICERRLVNNRRDTIPRLLLGAIQGYRGLLAAKQRNLVGAFFSAIKAKDYLKQVRAERPDLADASFGLGMVYYFASRKSEEVGGVLAWTIRRFITHGKDRRQEGIWLIEEAIAKNAWGADYARSALMWIRLFDGDYDKTATIATSMVKRYKRSALIRWVLGRVALEQNRCTEAQDWFDEVIAIKNREEAESINPAPDRYTDITMARHMAARCGALQKGNYDAATAHNDIVRSWLDGDPKISLEYQDEKNLLAHWRSRQEAFDEALTPSE